MTIANRIVLLCPPELHDLAEALAAALKEPNVIGMENVTVLTQPNVQMTVIVGSKRNVKLPFTQGSKQNACIDINSREMSHQIPCLNMCP